MDALNKAKQQLSTVELWFNQKVRPLAAESHPLKLVEWAKELDGIRTQIERPDRVRIALVGSTGAGKSTFLNAVLGQEVLPVGVMQPCTAFVTLVRQSDEPGYRVDVNFCSRDEWKEEVSAFAAYLRPGDDLEPQGEVESKRLVESARKRIQAVLGTEVGDGYSPDALVAVPLPSEAEEIFAGGSQRRNRFTKASDMLDHLRRLIRGESALWPLVKQVSISGPYDCLSGGLELVDLPGLNDPNAARVEVTREFLRTSPFVWVMFPMVRGLTQDIQQILGEEKLLRTLVFTGTYNALSLIGTKADDIDTNIAAQLGLDEDCETADLIREYRRQTEEQARAQLVEMVRDLAGPADEGDTLNRMLDLARRVTVHATSASGYMRLKSIGRLRKDYGIADPVDSGIPGIHDHLRRIAREVGDELIASMALRHFEQFKAEIAFFFRAAAKAATPEAEQVRRRIETEKIAFSREIDTSRSTARIRLEAYRETFMHRLHPMLKASVDGVSRASRDWQSIHWATLRAIVQRDGKFKSPSSGKSYDFNVDLTEPLMGQLPVAWEEYFTDDLGRVTDNYVVSVTKEAANFCGRVRLIIEMSFNRTDDFMEKQLAWFQDKMKLLDQNARARVLEKVTARRSELAETIPLAAGNLMAEAYGRAKSESGSGMKGRMLKHLQMAAQSAAPKIYDTIQSDLLEGLRDLDIAISGLFDELANAALGQADTVAANAAIDIDDATIDPAVKDLLACIPQAD